MTSCSALAMKMGSELPGRPGWNIILLDIDDKVGSKEKWEEFIGIHDELQTLTEKTTGGGLHYYFAVPKCDFERLPVKILKLPINGVIYGIDVIINGGLAICKPTKIPGRRNPCRWIPIRGPGEIPVASLPEWLLNLFLDRSVDPTPFNSPSPVLAGIPVMSKSFDPCVATAAPVESEAST